MGAYRFIILNKNNINKMSLNREQIFFGDYIFGYVEDGIIYASSTYDICNDFKPDKDKNYNEVVKLTNFYTNEKINKSELMIFYLKIYEYLRKNTHIKAILEYSEPDSKIKWKDFRFL